jgi:DNA polymerase/3'-5' exonuclease PolX
MSQSEKSYPLSKASIWAKHYQGFLEPYVERVEIVGSVRRGKSEVHDIEMLVIPLPGTQLDLFGVPQGNRLEENICGLAKTWQAELRMNGPQIKKLGLCEGPTLEIYISTLERWGVEMVIKTGNKEFSHKCVTARRQGGYLPSDCKIRDGWKVYRGERWLPMPEERDFLAFLGFPGELAPDLRNGDLRP